MVDRAMSDVSMISMILELEYHDITIYSDKIFQSRYLC